MSSPATITITVFKGSPSGAIVQSTTTRPPLTGDEVLISITASGLCSGDIHFQTTDMALGHEGVGLITSTGPSVISLKRGDRVGWGFLHSTCGRCTQCLSGTETFCPSRHMYGRADLEQGSLAHAIVKREGGVFRIPDELKDEEAAPLMCAGATVFNVLSTQGVRSTDRVGVVGVGGLGHLGIQFAAKMGCEVVAFSGTEEKREEAMGLGASKFCAMGNTKGIDVGGGGLDVLLVTSSTFPDWSLFLPILAPKARIFPLTISMGQLTIPYMPLPQNSISIQRSIITPRNIYERMLAFAVRHKIKPTVQKFRLDKEGIKEAFEVLRTGR